MKPINNFLLIISIFLLYGQLPIHAHTMTARIISGENVIALEFQGHGEKPFAGHPYVIRRPDGSEFEKGTTDAEGIVRFLPDREGEWTLHLYSEDGHGGAYSVYINAKGFASMTENTKVPAWLSWFFILLIFALPGLLAFASLRKKTN